MKYVLSIIIAVLLFGGGFFNNSVHAAAGCTLTVQLYSTITKSVVTSQSGWNVLRADAEKYRLRIEGKEAECSKAYVKGEYGINGPGADLLFQPTLLTKQGSVYRYEHKFGTTGPALYRYQISQMARNDRGLEVIATLPPFDVIFTDDKTLAGKPSPSAGNQIGGQLDDGPIPEISNPTSSKTLPALVLKLTQYLLSVIALVAIIMIIIAGFRMIIGSGDTGQIATAKKTIQWAILGLVLSLMAVSIVTIVQQVIRP